jgi:hypothetical protein
VSTTTQSKVGGIIADLESELHNETAARKDAEARAAAAEKTATALRQAAAAANTEIWTVPKAVALVESAALNATVAVGFVEMNFIRSHVAAIGLHGASVPFDGSGELSASLADESIFTLTTTGGGKTYVALEQDDYDSMLAWVGQPSGTPKKENQK